MGWLLLSILPLGLNALWLGGPKSFEAEPYVPPLLPASKLKLFNNGDGTISTPDYRYMQARKESYAHLEHCIDYYESVEL